MCYAVNDKVHLTVTVNIEVYTLQRAADDIPRHAKHTKTNSRITYTKLALLLKFARTTYKLRHSISELIYG